MPSWSDSDDSGSDPDLSSPSESKQNDNGSVRNAGFTNDEPSPPRAEVTEMIQDKKPGRRRRAVDETKPEVTQVEPTKSVSGWGGDDGGSFTKRSTSSNDMDSSATLTSGTAGSRKGRGGNNHFSDGDDIMVIPDLDDDLNEEEDITVQVAEAPKNVNRRVASLHELDSSIKYSVSSSENGVDLSVLTKNLVPIGSVDEKDESWDFFSLLQSVTQEFHKEKELSHDNDIVQEDIEAVKKQVTLTPAKELKEEDARRLDELVGGGGKVKKREGGRRRRGNDD
ncbi:hypothetical protein TrST_g13266 [Triparma strigata]|uniref:Uncharacterized protein n=1 Tax=Triparma strigata TaxID=1606541 RepID=A0A9W7AQ99_9STRA|nr:hypothetical protein TrST_g13266 [Triparma strigata]